MSSSPVFSYWRLSGPGQKRFLQGCTTSDFSHKKECVTSLLNTQGRVLGCAWIALAADEKSSLWVLEKSTVPSLQQHLSLATRFARLRWEELLDHGPLGKYDFVPWLQERHSGLFTGHDLSLDILGMVDFDKGCYTGQEIFARVQARTRTHKKRLFWIETKFEPKKAHHLYYFRGHVLSVELLGSDRTNHQARPMNSMLLVKATDGGPLF